MPKWSWGSKPPPTPPPPPTPRPGPFVITRLNQPVPAPRPAPPSPAPRDMFVARFRPAAAAAALTLIAAVRTETRRQPPVRRTADQAVWVEVRAPRAGDEEMAWALGGVVYRPDGTDVVSPRGHRQTWEDLVTWPRVSWVELAARTAPGTEPVEQQEILVVTTGPLAHWVVERFQTTGLDLRVSSARLSALFAGDTGDWAAALVRVTGDGRSVPPAAAHALSALPHTVVCRLSGDRLLIDQRLRLPVADSDLATEVPGDQEWLLTGGLGVWRVTERGREYTPALDCPPALLPPPVAPPGRIPANVRIEVTIRRDDLARRTDALLLRDDELPGLRRYVSGLPVAERAYLVLGPGLHLFADPAHDVADIPFGVPLHRIGPGALYQEVGYGLRPAISPPARARLFGVDDSTLVVLTADGAHRLRLEATVPAWSLWLGPVRPPDPAAEPLSAVAREILERVDAADARADPAVVAPATAPDRRRGDLRTEGFQLEQQGRLAEAAHKYWEAGDPAMAARLYEMAAEAGT